jgi:hypothetical protein
MDIVERLRQEIGGYTDVHLEKAETDMREAADEIERLRSELQPYREANKRLKDTYDTLRGMVDPNAKIEPCECRRNCHGDFHIPCPYWLAQK